MHSNLIETDEVLSKYKFFEVRLMNGWYEYLRPTHKESVCVTVIRTHNKQQQILARFERCPAHYHNLHVNKVLKNGLDMTSLTGLDVTSLTGLVDNPNLSCRETAAKELYEEAGIHIEPEELMYCGTVFPSKSSSLIIHLYIINMTDHPHSEPSKPTGDGTRGEEGAYCAYMDAEDFILSCSSPLPSATLVRYALLTEDRHKGMYRD